MENLTMKTKLWPVTQWPVTKVSNGLIPSGWTSSRSNFSPHMNSCGSNPRSDLTAGDEYDATPSSARMMVKISERMKQSDCNHDEGSEASLQI